MDSMEMAPKAGTDLKEWLGLALTRFALGGVSIGQVVEVWTNQYHAPKGAEGRQEAAPSPALEFDPRHFCDAIERFLSTLDSTKAHFARSNLTNIRKAFSILLGQAAAPALQAPGAPADLDALVRQLEREAAVSDITNPELAAVQRRWVQVTRDHLRAKLAGEEGPQGADGFWHGFPLGKFYAAMGAYERGETESFAAMAKEIDAWRDGKRGPRPSEPQGQGGAKV